MGRGQGRASASMHLSNTIFMIYTIPTIKYNVQRTTLIGRMSNKTKMRVPIGRAATCQRRIQYL